MIATERFVFLHLHKSGGSFVNDCLMRFVPDAQQIGYHLPRSLVPQPFAHLPVLGFVRNPWSYYVSWYTFQARRPQPNPLFRILSDDGQLGFEPTVRNMLDLGSAADNERLDKLVAALPTMYGSRGLNLPGFALERIRGSGRGFYSFLYRYMYDGPGVLHIGRMERLREELPALLSGLGAPLGAPLREFIQSAPARNVSEHADYAEYYSPQLRDLVAERDAEVIGRHAYAFGA
jgi:hypothetical protein